MTKFFSVLCDIRLWKYSEELPSPALILQSEWIWQFLFVWLDFMFREEGPLLWGGHLSSPQLQQLTGDSDWQVRRSRIWGLLFTFQQGKESSTPFCCLYSHWHCIPAKPRELQSCTTQRLCGLCRRIAFVSASLPSSASPSGGERARLTLLALQIKSSQALCA